MMQSATDKFVSRTLGAGEWFGLENRIHERDSDNAVWTQCDRVAVSSGEPCWTIEVHKTDNTASLWPAVRQWMLGGDFDRKRDIN